MASVIRYKEEVRLASIDDSPTKFAGRLTEGRLSDFLIKLRYE